MPAAKPFLILAAAVGAAATAALWGQPPPHEAAPPPFRPEIGTEVPPERLHLVKRPGLYGISDPAPGMQYAVVGSSLVRIEAGTAIVRSIIRGGVRPVD